MTPAQRLVLGVLADQASHTMYPGLTARQVAARAWPDDPGWQQRGLGRNGRSAAQGAGLPLRAGRVLAALERAGLAECDRNPDGPRGGRWVATSAGLRRVLCT